VQVGDLVELSAYGKKLKGFKWLRGHHGIVTQYIRCFGPEPGWRVHWFGRPNCVMERKSIKHVKVKKTLDKTTSA
jgi:hypothetical protein